uniref:RiboL-PSP-HEPN domain-containing protein n=1 Tax=candidate division WOR-3 bacterium TaxID=2052148 RepID=A0A7C4GG23_UNCW3
MNCASVASSKQRLDNLFELVGELPEEPFEIRAHWAKYLCVLCSGFIETATEAILTEYARRHGTPSEVLCYVRHRLQRFNNPKYEELLALLGIFTSAWREGLERLLGEEHRAAINSIVANRHRIAHGKDVTLSYHDVRGYYQKVLQAVAKLDRLVLGQ